MMLVHKSVEIRKDIWLKLRINAELSRSSLRDYLTLLIEESQPVDLVDDERVARLAEVAGLNKAMAAIASRSSATPSNNTATEEPVGENTGSEDVPDRTS